MAVLKAKGEQFRFRRDILYEWGVVAGEIGDYGLNAWLAGQSLADGGAPLDVKNCGLIVSGLGRAFELLHEATRQPIFANARAACGRLGLGLPVLDAKTRGFFKKHAKATPGGAGQRRSLEEDVKTLRP